MIGHEVSEDGRRRNDLPRLAWLLVQLVVAGSLLGSASAQETNSPPSTSQWRQIDELCGEGKYEEALEFTLSQLERLASARPYTPGFQHSREGYEMRAATIRFILNLPREARREMAVADSLLIEMYRFQDPGNFTAAREMAERRLAIVRRHLEGPHWDVARNLHWLAFLAACTGDLDRGEALFRESLAVRLELFGHEHDQVAVSLEHLGTIFDARSEYAKAEELYQEALNIMLRRAGGDKELALQGEITLRVLRRLVRVYTNQGDYSRAIPLLHKTLAATREYAISRIDKGSDYWLLASLLNDLAALLEEQGDPVSAKPLLQEALAIRRRVLGGEHPHVMRSINALGEVLCLCGEMSAAEPLLVEALSRSRESLGEDHPETTGILLSLASLRRSQGNFSEAELLAREALALRQRASPDDAMGIAECLEHLAGTYAGRGEPGEAVSLLRETLSIYTPILGRDHPSVARSLNDLGLCLLSCHELAEAESVLSRAAGAFETARLRAGTGYSRATFQTSPYRALAATCLARGEQVKAWPATERASGRALADLLIATGGRQLSPAELAVQDSLLKLLDQLEGHLLALGEAEHFDPSAGASREFDEARTRLATADAAWSAFQRSVALKYPVTEGQTFTLDRVQRTLAEHSALIGWLHLEWGREEHASWGYVIRPDGPVRWVPLETSSDGYGALSSIDKERDLRDALAIASSWAERPTEVTRITGEAVDVWEKWMAPLEVHLDGIEHLIVVPSGPMLGIPVEALVDAEVRSLVDRYVITYAPSATIYAWLREQGEGRREAYAPRKALLVGDPPFSTDHLLAMTRESDDSLFPRLMPPASSVPMLQVAALRSALAGDEEALARLPRLPWTRVEVEQVASAIPTATVLLGPDASEQWLAELAESGELGTYDTIHLATHALVDVRRPERSALVLSRTHLPDPVEAVMNGNRVYDGLLTASEIVRHWDLEAELVTLSACQTGLGRATAEEGYIGLTHSFLQAGARSVLVSLWKVEEEATALLMGRFYHNLASFRGDEHEGRFGESMPKAAALREAKQWLRDYTVPSELTGDPYRPFNHPSFWSGFILMGEP